MKLYFSRNPNPRLAVAVARYLKSPVTFEFARPFQPDQRERFRKLNPNLSIPILELEDRTIWEGDAIACYLSQYAASDFWPLGEKLPDIIRWLSWGYWNFVRACNMVQFERVTRQRYGMGPVRRELVEEGLEDFSASAEILEQHLASTDWVIGKGVTYADFRMATFLPLADAAGLPLGDFPRVQAWHERLMQIPAWRDPFEGLEAPELPPLGVATQA